MSNYTALYRQWRPKIFEEVVGQTDIIEILKNQIQTGNIGHAYLFSGTRGTGKTSTAKIFSRAINCLDSSDSNPCNVCEICTGILEESIMDVVEIDAASNNGVDDIRELRENVKYPPSRSRYKVYIIDEVHMLSTGAFNALLKTLEEPPQYVVFILATTEPHKLPATILSRCQRFDFKRVGGENLKGLLEAICSANQVTCESEALELIIKKSDGAVRDSQSMLDQCLSACDGHLSQEAVLKALGLVDIDFLTNLVDAVIQKDVHLLFEQVNLLTEHGRNLSQFVKDFLDYQRDLMVTASMGSAEKVQKTSADAQILVRQANVLGLSRIMRDMGRLIELDNQMKWSTNTRIQLEMFLVKLCEEETPSLGVANIAAMPNRETVRAVKETGVMKETSVISAPSKGAPSNASAVKEAIKEKMTESPKEIPAVVEPIVDSGVEANFSVVAQKWQEVVQYLARNKKASISALLIEGKLMGLSGKVLQIGYPDGYGFHLNAIARDENRQEVERAIYAVTGYALRAQFDYLDAFSANTADVKSQSEVSEELKSKLGEYADKLELL